MTLFVAGVQVWAVPLTGGGKEAAVEASEGLGGHVGGEGDGDDSCEGDQDPVAELGGRGLQEKGP